MDQTDFYEAKLTFETDAWDLPEDLKKGLPLVVVDARAHTAYEKEHIPSAINFPHRTMDGESTKHLDKSKTYVTYCDGIGCNASTKAALKLAKLGFTVKELLGGLDWWKRDGYEIAGSKNTPGTKIACGC